MLQLSSALVAKHHFGALSNRSRGSSLRVAMQDAQHHDLPAAGAHHQLSTAPQSRLPRNLVGLTIVVVDDDEASRDYFAIALRSCGASVLTTSTARDALRLVQEQRPDVVLSDIAMSEHDGYWLASEIRRLAEPAANRVPIIAATAYGREHSRERVLAAGFVEHLQKPVDPELLARTIERVARR